MAVSNREVREGDEQMDRRTFLKTVPAMTMLAGSASGHDEGGLEAIVLPKPQTDGGKTVLAALRERRTNRNIGAKELSPPMLSNLLWAAFGINRAQGAFGKPGRTAPSASNSQEIDLYVALPQGVYLYEAAPHRLSPVLAGDLRARSGRRAARTAPVNIFYVADLSRYDRGPDQPDRNIGDPEVQKSYYYVATGLIAQNVYLFCASQGLAAWFHNCDRENAGRELKLRSEQRVLFAQTVGYPA